MVVVWLKIRKNDIVGFKLKEAYDILNETYNFEKNH